MNITAHHHDNKSRTIDCLPKEREWMMRSFLFVFCVRHYTIRVNLRLGGMKLVLPLRFSTSPLSLLVFRFASGFHSWSYRFASGFHSSSYRFASAPLRYRSWCSALLQDFIVRPTALLQDFIAQSWKLKADRKKIKDGDWVSCFADSWEG